MYSLVVSSDLWRMSFEIFSIGTGFFFLLLSKVANERLKEWGEMYFGFTIMLESSLNLAISFYTDFPDKGFSL